MNLIKTSFWQGIATIIKFLAGLITTKIMAIFVGPAGVALIGNFNNITSMFIAFSNGGISSGITKYVAEYEDNHESQLNVVAHAIKINLVCSSVIGIIVLVFNKYLTSLIFGNLEYSSIVLIFGLTIIFYGLNATISAIINGYKQVKYLIISGMIGSVLSVILAIIITMKFKLYGALINTIIAQICFFFINIYFVWKMKFFRFDLLKMKFDKALLWNLFKYAIMSLTTVLVVPTGTFIIRNYIYNHFSVNEAGFVQGVWGISSVYLMVITTTLSTYYLPMLSSIKEDSELRKEIFKGYKFLLPLATIGGIGVYFCRDIIIHILYTSEFMPMRELFMFQIIGDFFKIASWILAFNIVAKSMARWYIISEVLFSFSYVGFSFCFMHYFGSVGVMYAYALNYFLYLMFILWLFRDLIFMKEKKILNIK